MQLPEDSVLGKVTDYQFEYNSDLLFPVPRVEGRVLLGITALLPFQGIDRWTAYELSWLNADGLPQVMIAELDFPCESPCIIESKSLKLYLNSFNQTVFISIGQVKETLVNDLSVCCGASVDVRLYAVQDYVRSAITDFSCIDHLAVKCTNYQPTPSLLSYNENTVQNYHVCSHLFRSLCPVTGQPDWATLYISYSGKQINEVSLLQYIVSFRNHQGFHEQCVEQVYMDLLQYCQPEKLSVYGRFVRRGGLDINPFRTSHASDCINIRDSRQ